MRLGSKDAREFKALAESFGWRFAGLTSNGHLRWRHHDHGEFVTSSTPTSWWWARKDLFAAMGQPVPVKSRGGRKSRRTRAVQEPNKINALLRMARTRGMPTEIPFAEKLLADRNGDLAGAQAMLELLIERAERIKARRHAAAQKRQPWDPRPRRSLTVAA